MMDEMMSVSVMGKDHRLKTLRVVNNKMHALIYVKLCICVGLVIGGGLLVCRD